MLARTPGENKLSPLTRPHMMDIVCHDALPGTEARAKVLSAPTALISRRHLSPLMHPQAQASRAERHDEGKSLGGSLDVSSAVISLQSMSSLTAAIPRRGHSGVKIWSRGCELTGERQPCSSQISATGFLAKVSRPGKSTFFCQYSMCALGLFSKSVVRCLPSEGGEDLDGLDDRAVMALLSEPGLESLADSVWPSGLEDWARPRP
mmetsp:Transcript_682/g.1634  ORF Transcript_682/g.1634 Transcript_682/m.1634 type:complete len:206 (+) Transcript_682:2038-2655(+)